MVVTMKHFALDELFEALPFVTQLLGSCLATNLDRISNGLSSVPKKLLLNPVHVCEFVVKLAK